MGRGHAALLAGLVPSCAAPACRANTRCRQHRCSLAGCGCRRAGSECGRRVPRRATFSLSHPNSAAPQSSTALAAASAGLGGHARAPPPHRTAPPPPAPHAPHRRPATGRQARPTAQMGTAVQDQDQPVPSCPGLAVRSSAQKGRHLVCTRAFKAGDCVLKQRPFAAVLNEDALKQRCDACYALSSSLSVCSRSKLARWVGGLRGAVVACL